MDMQRINVHDIVLGKPLPWNVYDGDGTLLLRAGNIVESRRQLEGLTDRGLFLQKQASGAESHVVVQHEKISPFMLLENIFDQMERLFGRIGVDDNFTEKVHGLCHTVQQACGIDVDAAMAFIFIGMESRYPIMHPVHVAVLCELVTKHMEWPDDERRALLAAALTMNFGMLNLQQKLHAQKEPLTEAQRTMISEHPDKSEELLRQAGVTDNAWLDAVRQHHEFMDGAGYPQGLKGEAISRLARVIKLADIYCALVSGRAYRTAMLQNSAMRELFMQRGKQVDGQLTEQFVKVVGIYPPGTFVRLANAEIAVATRHGASASAPMVQSVVGPRGSPLAVYGKRDCGKADFAIREVISKAQANVKINRHMLWGYE